ncbi:B9 domain-containing protein 2 [Anoplophora glabripennis]|uniref:B9 domain-containing protein 2 n=1 Tax=Anoplophora glabripennis TaxID=217634 RepID=UPI0008751EAB|nr:B9 domain-containing protein 2 [Anoplophora glabripennis]
MAEVHIIGQINQAKDFPKQHLFCKWYLHIGNNWRIISGKKEGQTHVSFSQFSSSCIWSFPIDVHLATAGLQGWPKIYIEVYHLDWLGRSHLFGYGLVTVPTSPGNHTLDCYTWRPFGSLKERFVQYFLGGGLQLKYPDLIFSSGERYKLSTEAMGVVSFDLTIILRNFTNYGIEYN